MLLPAELLLFTLAFLASGVVAQTPLPTHRLQGVDAAAPEPLSLVKGIRELSDGRLLVTDWIEERLVVVDFDAGTIEDIGRVGAGPRAFRLPGQLVALPADSTLLVDVGNGRLSVLDPDLRFVRTVSVRAHGEQYTMNPRGADRHGALFFQLSPFSGGPGVGRLDSVPIGRWEQGHPVTFVGAGVRLKTYTSRPPGPSVGIPYVPFSKQDDWALAPDGWVAVVRSSPYRIEWYGPDGASVMGRTVEYERLAVTMEDRRAEVREFLRSTSMSGRGENGGMGHVPADLQSDREVDRMARQAQFAEEFPPFVSGAVWAPASGYLWVQRALPVGSVPTFDIFDRLGARVAAVELPSGRRVVGFGAGTIYTTVADPDDLLTLERYRVPTFRN